jgi:hypothetical protein
VGLVGDPAVARMGSKIQVAPALYPAVVAVVLLQEQVLGPTWASRSLWGATWRPRVAGPACAPRNGQQGPGLTQTPRTCRPGRAGSRSRLPALGAGTTAPTPAKAGPFWRHRGGRTGAEGALPAQVGGSKHRAGRRKRPGTVGRDARRTRGSGAPTHAPPRPPP